jgi:hypothetical protein
MFFLYSHPNMKRCPDLLRQLLLSIEGAEGAELLHMPAIDGFDRPMVHFHVQLLIQVGFVQAHAELRHPRRDWLALSLTWKGYDYLETIRDPVMWRLVRRSLAKTGGWSIDTIAAIAKAFVLAKAEGVGLAVGA